MIGGEYLIAVYCKIRQVIDMNLEILPLAITMMAGPQIMSALFLVTSRRPIANSLLFILGVAFAASVGVIAYSALAQAFNIAVPLNDGKDPTGVAKVVQLVLVGLLVWLAIKSFRERKHPKQPKWMASILDSTPRRAFTLAATLIFLMPTDIIAMLTVGINLTSNNLGFTDALPFLLLTTLIAATPLLIYLLFYKKAKAFMPKVRDWMNSHSWAINIAVYALFVYLILGD